jgi:adenylate cyclase
LEQRLAGSLRRRLGLATLLAGAFAGLVGVALATVLAIQIFVGRDAALELFRDKGELLVELVHAQVRAELDPAAIQLAFVAEVLGQPGARYAKGEIADLLTGALAGAPGIRRLVFLGADYSAVIVDRQEDGASVSYPDLSVLPQARQGLTTAATRTGGYWGEFLFVQGIDGPAVNRRHSVWRDGRFVGALAGLVELRELSEIVERSPAAAHGGRAFVLSGREHVLAHPRLREKFTGLGPDRPLPRIDEVGDPVLAALWTERGAAAPFLGRIPGGKVVPVAGENYMFLQDELPGFGDPPWIVGAYFPLSDIASSIRTLALSGVAGIGVMLLALVVAVMLGRRLAAPTRHFARAAAALADLEFGKAQPLPGSRIVELDEQAQAFNRLLGALRWFEAYVPRNLVRRLARETPPKSEERILTVMFTDLAGFTTLSQDMPPAEVADLLNAHFAQVIRAVEESGGTVDKFMGDGMMAFWGAPDRLKGHARRALACAAGLDSSTAGTGLRLRVGIHTGRVVVGNIGSEARMNYTIVGDAVNATQRIEQLGKDLMGPDERGCFLASEDTWEAADKPADWVRVGEFTLRGRDSPVAIYRYAPARAAAR